MPSYLHEALIDLFRSRTTLASELLADVFEVELPAHHEAVVTEGDLTLLVPTELRADLVVLLREGTPVYGIVVEVQLSEDGQKKFVWPLYCAALRARHRCPVALLVVTPHEGVAAWASEPIEVGPAWSFRPTVLGPDAVRG